MKTFKEFLKDAKEEYYEILCENKRSYIIFKDKISSPSEIRIYKKVSYNAYKLTYIKCTEDNDYQIVKHDYIQHNIAELDKKYDPRHWDKQFMSDDEFSAFYLTEIY